MVFVSFVFKNAILHHAYAKPKGALGAKSAVFGAKMA
jgi:hypothetical protein